MTTPDAKKRYLEDLERIREALARLGVAVDEIDDAAADATVKLLIAELSEDFANRLIERGFDPALRLTYRAYYEMRAFPWTAISSGGAAPSNLVPDGTRAPVTPSTASAVDIAKDLELNPSLVDAMEAEIQIVAELVSRDPSTPARRDRFIATVAQYIDSGLAPTEMLAKAIRSRPEGTTGYLAEVWAAQTALEEQYRQATVFTSYLKFVQDTQAEPVQRGDLDGVIVPSFKSFTGRPEEGPEVSGAFMDAINKDGGNMTRAYRRILANVGETREGLDKDVMSADVAQMEEIFDEVYGNTNDIHQAKRAAINAGFELAGTVAARTAQAKLTAQKQAFLDEEFKDVGQIITDWALDNKLNLDEAQTSVLRRVLTDYVESFDAGGVISPISPQQVLAGHIEGLAEAISATQRRDEIQERFDKAYANPAGIVSDFAALYGYKLDDQLKVAFRRHLEGVVESFDPAAGIDHPDPFSVLDDFMQNYAPTLRAEQHEEDIATREAAQTSAFTAADLQQWLAGQNVSMSPADQRATLERIWAIGIDAALAEVQDNAQRFANRAEAQEAQANPSSFIRQLLIERGVITPDSGEAFLENLEQTVIAPLGRSLSIGFAQDPALAGDHLGDFIDSRLRGFSPTSLSEEAFARSQGFDFPGAPDLDAATGLPIRRPVPATDPTAFRSFIQEMEQTETPSFLSFLLNREPDLAAQFAETQRPRIDENLYDTRLRNLMGIQKQQQALALPPEADAVFPGAAVPSPRASAALQSPLRTASLERLRGIARQGATVTPPTTQEFFAGKLPGLRSQFASSAPQIVERARTREDEAATAARSAERTAEEAQARLRRRRVPLSVFRKGRT